ncbi:hypothetical protein FRB94_012232 [Tulasnella sp. JGI-2019a]|nr:hypothetical protein FRB93_005787 [Tulasnella sp. JGI-2019a]KAG8991797.1 hypothetical protein FRB94_012232 [Tulasnella sp. JGI-2019a]KAG9027382.1 hypothetical protein FRB95_007814 [Tulasnella sp. JGI-2019a]
MIDSAPIEPPEDPEDPLRYWFQGLQTTEDAVRTEQDVYQTLEHAQGHKVTRPVTRIEWTTTVTCWKSYGVPAVGLPKWLLEKAFEPRVERDYYATDPLNDMER